MTDQPEWKLQSKSNAETGSFYRREFAVVKLTFVIRERMLTYVTTTTLSKILHPHRKK